MTARRNCWCCTRSRQARPAGRHAGLYHFALLLSHAAGAGARRAAAHRDADAGKGASDHGTHEAIYLPDPDGNGIELAADRAASDWPRDLGYAGGPEPLDIDGLLATVEGEAPRPRSRAVCAWATCTCTWATSSAGSSSTAT